jgi:uncharacterized protein (DUF1810 family)
MATETHRSAAFGPRRRRFDAKPTRAGAGRQASGVEAIYSAFPPGSRISSSLTLQTHEMRDASGAPGRDNGGLAPDVERFIRAQDGVYEDVVAELRRGRKTSHWIWFVFPQITGLGRSPMAQRYAIASLDEAREYGSHPVLGPRLRQCARLLLATNRPPIEVLGQIDAVKVRSSMTLFERAVPEEPVFGEVLDRLYDGERDGLTLDRI